MTHSDDDGLIIPPKLAPQHAIIVPFYRKNEDENNAVKAACEKLEQDLMQMGYCKVRRKRRPTRRKIYENERKGVCMRIGIGPRDLKNEVVEYKRRDQESKQSVSINGFVDFAKAELESMKALFEAAKSAKRTRYTLIAMMNSGAYEIR